MLTWFMQNLATILISAVLFTVAAIVIVNMVKKKKRGGGSCGCGCSGCPMSGACHKEEYK